MTECSGIVGLPASDVVADRAIPRHFYVGKWNDGFWRSDDCGHTFYESHSGAPVRCTNSAGLQLALDREFAASNGAMLRPNFGLRQNGDTVVPHR